MSHANSNATETEESNADKPVTPHIDQSIPYEWRTYTVGEETLLVHDVPESTVACYRVTGLTRNPRAMMTADRVLYNGQVTDPFYEEETKRVILTHSWAGTIDRLWVEDWLDTPAVTLEQCESANLASTVEGLPDAV